MFWYMLSNPLGTDFDETWQAINCQIFVNIGQFSEGPQIAVALRKAKSSITLLSATALARD